MEEIKNIVSVMIEQNRGLQKDLAHTLVLSTSEEKDFTEIEKSLEQFHKDLLEHIHLENDIFYVQLLEQMKNKGQDTVKTEIFISEMKKIGESVMSFLDKYKEPNSINSQLANFQTELNGVISVLNLRIDTEESGVYAYWGLF